MSWAQLRLVMKNIRWCDSEHRHSFPWLTGKSGPIIALQCHIQRSEDGVVGINMSQHAQCAPSTCIITHVSVTTQDTVEFAAKRLH